MTPGLLALALLQPPLQGYSGPAVLDVSHWLVKELEQQQQQKASQGQPQQQQQQPRELVSLCGPRRSTRTAGRFQNGTTAANPPVILAPPASLESTCAN